MCLFVVYMNKVSNELSKTVKNASWIIICKLLQSVLNLVIGMITARYLGPSNYGLINYAASITAFFVPLMRLGLTSTLVREFVSDPQNEGGILGTSLVLNIVSSIASIIGISTFSMLAHRNEPETIVVCILYSFTLLFQAAEMSQYWFQAKLLSKFPSVASLAAYVVVSIYKIYILISDKSVYWFSVTHVIEACIVAIVLMLIYRRISHQKLTFSFSLARKLLSASKYYIISGMAVTILQNTDRFMLKMMITDESTGYYSVAATCAGMFAFVYTAIIDSMRPQILQQKSVSNEKYEEYLSILYAVLFYTSLIQGVVTTVFADIIVNLLYGAEYLPAVNALRISVWVNAFAYFGSVVSIWILGEGNDKIIVWMGLFGAACNVILNLLLIPRFGASGAAMASLLAQILKNICFCMVNKSLRRTVVIMLNGINPRFAITQIRKMI